MEKVVKISIPKKYDLENMFPTYTWNSLNFVKFIIHQVNKSSTGYQIHMINHAYFFGVNSSVVKEIVDILITNNIIRKIGNYQAGVRSNCYLMVEKFYIEDKTNNNITEFNLGRGTTPKFIYRWVSDDYVVKSRKDSNYSEEKKKEIVNKCNLENSDAQIQYYVKVKPKKVPSTKKTVKTKNPSIEECLLKIQELEDKVKYLENINKYLENKFSISA